MASRVAEITADLESAFHGETINYNGEDKVITAERERFQNVINGRYPFVLISGPVVDVESRAHRVSNCMLHYLITFMDDTINDDYSSESTIDPITKVVEDVAADLIKLAMADRTRNGYAINTAWSGSGHYFDDIDGKLMFNVFVQFEIKTFINTIDPYLGG